MRMPRRPGRGIGEIEILTICHRGQSWDHVQTIYYSCRENDHKQIHRFEQNQNGEEEKTEDKQDA